MRITPMDFNSVNIVTTGKTGNCGTYLKHKHGGRPLLIRLVSFEGPFLHGQNRGRNYVVLAEDYEPYRSTR
jgi:hypothetical protein